VYTFTNARGARAIVVATARESLQIEQKARMKMRAVARNIDFVSVSEKALAGAFAWVAARVRVICCYASAIPQPICEALAELFSCRPRATAKPSPSAFILVAARPSAAVRTMVRRLAAGPGTG
jgi:hypothetical protein